MSFALQKSPLGLLELFNLKSGGLQPNQFAEQLQGGFDAVPFYGADRLFTANTVAAAAAFPLNLTVNADFARLYIGFSVQVTLGAAAGTRLAIRIGLKVPSPASPLIVLADARYAAPHLVAGEFNEAIFLAPYPFVLPPGAQWNASARSDAAGADHVLTAKALSYNLTSAA